MIRGGHNTTTSRTPYASAASFLEDSGLFCRYYSSYVMKLFGALFLFFMWEPEREQLQQIPFSWYHGDEITRSDVSCPFGHGSSHHPPKSNPLVLYPFGQSRLCAYRRTLYMSAIQAD